MIVLLFYCIISSFMYVYGKHKDSNTSTNTNTNTNNDELNLHSYSNDITKCNGDPFPSLPLRTLTQLGICGSNDILHTPYYNINCTHIDSIRDYSFSNYILNDNNRKHRYQLLKSIVNNGKFKPYNGKLVLVTVVNTGFLFLFYNWLCSIENNIGNIESTINSLIILAADDEASMILSKQGFNVISLKAMVPNEKNYEISKLPPAFFGSNNIALQKGCLITMGSDLLTMGYELILFDVDTVWKKDFKPYLSKFGHNIDMLVTHDGRYHYDGNIYDVDAPLNSGFIYARPNCRTRIALDTLSANIDLAFKHLGSTDQGVFNMIIYQSPKFRTLRLGILPWHLFINGHVYHRDKFSSIDWNRVMMIHASWTTNWKMKIKKFMMTNDYYYQQGNCSYYNKEYDLMLKNNNTLNEDVVNTD